MAEIEVPPYFLCPISLEIMKDPVTMPTGITYERDNIEKWIFSEKNHTCPVTKQPLSDESPTPNITLRRLIQSWCTLHASYGVERLPTPKPAVTKPDLLKLLATATATTPQTQTHCLQRLRSIASHSQTNRRCMEKSGAADFLASFIINKNIPENSSESIKSREDALSILYSLQLSESGLNSLANKPHLIDCLIEFMRSGSYGSRVYAVMLMKSMVDVSDPSHLINLAPLIFVELVNILKDQICRKATKATLKLLITICAYGRNRIKSVEVGLVGVVIDLLLESTENKRAAEMMLMVLDSSCQCAEGRAALLQHGAGLSLVSKKILRVSHVASERALRILHWVSKFSATPAVLQEMLQMGVVAKLCLVMQVDCGVKTKERAREILRLHARTWKNSPCLPNTLIYP